MSDLTRMLVPLSGGQFPGWPSSAQPTAVEFLVVVLGIPLALMAIIATLAFAGTLARRGRGETLRVGDPIWLGQTASGQEVTAGAQRAALTTGTESIDATTGGASVRW